MKNCTVFSFASSISCGQNRAGPAKAVGFDITLLKCPVVYMSEHPHWMLLQKNSELISYNSLGRSRAQNYRAVLNMLSWVVTPVLCTINLGLMLLELLYRWIFASTPGGGQFTSFRNKKFKYKINVQNLKLQKWLQIKKETVLTKIWKPTYKTSWMALCDCSRMKWQSWNCEFGEHDCKHNCLHRLLLWNGSCCHMA